LRYASIPGSSHLFGLLAFEASDERPKISNGPRARCDGPGNSYDCENGVCRPSLAGRNRDARARVPPRFAFWREQQLGRGAIFSPDPVHLPANFFSPDRISIDILFPVTMRTIRKLLCPGLAFFILFAPRCAFAGGKGAADRAQLYDYTAFRLSTSNRNSEAIIYYTAAIKANPADFVAHFNRAGCYLRASQWSKARQDCDTAARLNPSFATTYYLRAVALYRLGHDAQCRADLDRSEQGETPPTTRSHIANLRTDLCQASLNPSFAEIRKSLSTLDRAVARAKEGNAVADALNDRAWFLAVCRNLPGEYGDRAVVDARRACEVTHWADKDCVDTLAAAYAKVGDFPKAIETARKAVAMAWNDPSSQREFRRHLAAFERQQPYNLTPADRE
jgi:Flp pilus assembly protein TadD